MKPRSYQPELPGIEVTHCPSEPPVQDSAVALDREAGVLQPWLRRVPVVSKHEMLGVSESTLLTNMVVWRSRRPLKWQPVPGGRSHAHIAIAIAGIARPGRGYADETGRNNVFCG